MMQDIFRYIDLYSDLNSPLIDYIKNKIIQEYLTYLKLR